MRRWTEIIEDDKGRLSSTRLSMLVGVGVLSAVVLMMTLAGKTDAGVIGIYAALCAGVYGIGKISSDNVEKASMNPPPVPQQPLAALGPTTVISVGEKPDRKRRGGKE